VIVGLDTSVVVRLLSGQPEDLAVAALRDLRKRQRARDRVLVSDLVLAEAYYALQYHYGASKKTTLEALRSFLGSPAVEASEDALEVLATPDLESAKPGFVDRLIYRAYLRSGTAKMITFEKAAAHFSAVRVLEARGT
jgi:predicted nucleic-acid-binding protein